MTKIDWTIDQAELPPAVGRERGHPTDKCEDGLRKGSGVTNDHLRHAVITKRIFLTRDISSYIENRYYGGHELTGVAKIQLAAQVHACKKCF